MRKADRVLWDRLVEATETPVTDWMELTHSRDLIEQVMDEYRCLQDQGDRLFYKLLHVHGGDNVEGTPQFFEQVDDFREQAQKYRVARRQLVKDIRKAVADFWETMRQLE